MHTTFYQLRTVAYNAPHMDVSDISQLLPDDGGIDYVMEYKEEKI